MRHALLVEDDYKIFDKLAHQRRMIGGMVGWARVFKNAELKDGVRVAGTGECCYDDHNLILAAGRAIVAHKLFDQESSQNLAKFTVTHFAVGAGGASLDSNGLVTLLGPYICDTGLSKPISLGSFQDEPGGYIGTPPSLYNAQGAVKPITVDGSIVIENETFENSINDPTTCSHGTRVKCTCTVIPGEPSGLNTGASVPISEACLYATYGNTILPFAKICFPPKYIELADTFIIDWFILC